MAALKVIIAGLDGSEPSREALRYAVREANQCGAKLRVVTAFEPPEYWAIVYGAPISPSSGELAAAVRAEAQETVDETLAELRVRDEVEFIVKAGSAAEVLLNQSADADLLVVGHRGRGGLASTLLGSVGLQCVLHASCPVTVVRPSTDTPTRIESHSEKGADQKTKRGEA